MPRRIGSNCRAAATPLKNVAQSSEPRARVRLTARSSFPERCPLMWRLRPDARLWADLLPHMRRAHDADSRPFMSSISAAVTWPIESRPSASFPALPCGEIPGRAARSKEFHPCPFHKQFSNAPCSAFRNDVSCKFALARPAFRRGIGRRPSRRSTGRASGNTTFLPLHLRDLRIVISQSVLDRMHWPSAARCKPMPL